MPTMYIKNKKNKKIRIIEGVLNGDRILNFMDTFEISSP
jgi:hypothetical protein